MLISNIKLLEEKNPLLALKVRMEAFAMQKAEVIYVYGVGEIPSVEGARVVFFEDDMERLSLFLHLKTAERFLQDPNVSFFAADTESLKKALWETALLSYQVISLKKEGFSAFHKELESLREGIFLSICDVKDQGRRVTQNILKNMEIPCFEGLALHLKGVPAIVCGAGPSLKEHREWVRENKNKAFILACGSAIELIEEAHAGACLDPLQPQEGYEKPLFYQNRVSHAFLKKVTGKRFNMGHGGGFPVEELFFGEGRFFDAGWNAGNFGVAIAEALGCFPIVTVGIDHAGGYAPGIDREKGSLDFKMGQEWMEERSLLKPHEVDLVEEVKICLEGESLVPLFSQGAWKKSWERCKTHVKGLPSPLHEVELEEEVVYQYHLAPLWEIWKYLSPERGAFFALVLQGGL